MPDPIATDELRPCPCGMTDTTESGALTLLRETVLPILRRSAEDLLRCVSVRNDPATVSGSDWRYMAEDMEAVLAVEALVGRPDDDCGRVLNPILDAAPWRHHTATPTEDHSDG